MWTEHHIATATKTMITTCSCSSSPIFSFVSSSNLKAQFSSNRSPPESPNHVKVRSISCRTRYSSDKPEKFNGESSSCAGRFCSCGRRRFIETASTALIPVYSSKASDLHSDYAAMMNKFHPQRPDWYEEFFASAMESCMKPYEVEVAGYKSQLFTNLKGKAENVLEIGIGTGPNLKYYAGDTGVHVIGVDPNRKMEKYAKAAAVAAGLPLTNFNFMQAVGEALPLSDASVDAVVGTLVLCSVKDVNMTLKEVLRVLKPGGLYLFVEHVAARDGTVKRILQNILDPLEQAVADGCHLTRETGNNIVEAGFSNVDIQTKFFSTFPYVYGIACK